MRFFFLHAICVDSTTHMCVIELGHLSFTWNNFNPSVDKYSHAQESVGWIT